MTEIVKGLKEIKILNVGDYFAERVSAGATISANSEKRLYLHSFLPRYFIEFILVVTLTIVLVSNVYINTEINSLIGTLGIFLVASLRLLPSVNSIIQILNDISIDKPAIEQLYDEIFLLEGIK